MAEAVHSWLKRYAVGAGAPPPSHPGAVVSQEHVKEAHMPDHQTDQQVLGAIKKLVDEEHALHTGGTPDAAAQARLRTVRVELDQCWDLLRQRRALREFGDDPDKAKVRPPQVVENYEQ
jgi:hypothetical protein